MRIVRLSKTYKTVRDNANPLLRLVYDSYQLTHFLTSSIVHNQLADLVCQRTGMRALDNLSLTVQEGSLLCLLGYAIHVATTE